MARYKWTPSKAQRREFAQRMQDPVERAAYEERKRERAAKRRATSKFDYESAGGNYVPTQHQHEIAMRMQGADNLSVDQSTAAGMVVSGYVGQEKVHHDYIHVVNEYYRNNIS